MRPDLVNKKFGKLFVLRLVSQDENKPSSRSKRMWECRCDCGNIKIFSTSRLTFKEKNNGGCGCGRHESRPNLYKKESGYSSITCLFARYRGKAKLKNKEFSLTRKEFERLIFSNCSYCGRSPFKEFSVPPYNGSVVYNGIDKVDPLKGYTLDNCTPCCWDCNSMKMDLSEELFLDKVAKIYENLKSKGIIND